MIAKLNRQVDVEESATRKEKHWESDAHPLKRVKCTNAGHSSGGGKEPER